MLFRSELHIADLVDDVLELLGERGPNLRPADDADAAQCPIQIAVRMDLHPRYAIAVVVPDFDLPTSKARKVLPDSYSRADTIFNVQRSALLITALATGETDAFPTALEDRMHQPYRAPLVPGLEEILKLRDRKSTRLNSSH